VQYRGIDAFVSNSSWPERVDMNSAERCADCLWSWHSYIGDLATTLDGPSPSRIY